MPIKNRIAEMYPEIVEWRQHLHQYPELGYEVYKTAAFVAEKLRQFGCNEVVTGVGRTGVIGVIKGNTNTKGKVVGLRADMDALPITEATGLEYASKLLAECMLAAMMAIQQCCLVRQNILPRPAILMVPWF